MERGVQRRGGGKGQRCKARGFAARRPCAQCVTRDSLLAPLACSLSVCPACALVQLAWLAWLAVCPITVCSGEKIKEGNILELALRLMPSPPQLIV
eukprot:scaffold155788_cov35-Tisochrysis_lutea.AAC.1